MKNIYETQNDGHDFFPYGDWGRKPTRNEVVEWVTDNIPIKIEHLLDSEDRNINKGSLTHQLNKFTTDEQYRLKQVKDATDYIMDMDWQELANKYGWANNE